MPNTANSPRARDLGIPLDGTPGAFNAITDVEGVLVGHTTLIEGDGALEVGRGPVRTGVTVVMPRGRRYDPVFAASHALNGNGEMTGTIWIEESGFLEGPIAITNTHSVGVVRDAIIAWEIKNQVYDPVAPGIFWSLPVVAETYDGILNDVNGFHVRSEHVFAALDSAAGGQVAEGAVGGGTGMICHGFKGGIGTASRQLSDEAGGFTVGALVQANYGARRYFTVAGVPVGRELAELPIETHNNATPPPGTGSIIIIVATDAPLLPHQLKRLTRRIPLGIGRVGGMGENTSGDIFMAFSTANPGAAKRHTTVELQMLSNESLNPLFEATIQATEEAILNALVAAKTTIGVNGNTAHALPHERLREILRKYGRLNEALSP
ncbi:MAG TPA: P1 family peptidase [Phototrophicaceae bacterium]|nr:P1 family peptidase [Phototrophicaceae bacterium]